MKPLRFFLLALLLAATAILLIRPTLEGPSTALHTQTHLSSAQTQPITAQTVPKLASGESIVTQATTTPLDEFLDWSGRFLKANEFERYALEAEGRRLAEVRRPVFKELIKTDPRRALEKAVPMVVRQKLPVSILAQLEDRVNEVGVMRVMQGVPMPGEPLPRTSLTIREVEMKSGKTYRAHVYGLREALVTWTPNASLNGVAMDADFAVNEQPSRTLEIGEIPPAGKPAVTDCPVSGKQVFKDATAITEIITADTPAVETATETLYFCNTMHIDVQNQTMIMGEGVSGGAFGFTGILPAAPTPAIGTVKVLIIPMTYADQNAVPSTEEALYRMLRDVSEFYSKASFGRLTLTGVVTPPVKLKHNEAWYVNRDTSNGGDISGTGVEHAESRDEARKLGYDSNDYDCIGVRHEGGPGSYGGLGGGSSVWARSDSPGLWAHEIGHCFGLAHANFWDTAGTSSIGNGANNEYGDTYDNMGSGPYPGGHYNAQAKSQVRWLTANFLQPVTQSGLYRIYAMDTGVLDPAHRYALNIVKDAQKTYWGEVRTLQDTNPWIKSGLILGWRYPGGSGSNIQVIDTTNGSPFGKEDAPISIGRTFSDTESGIHMTTVATNDNPRYMDLQVNFGDYPTNQPPTMTLAASAAVVPVNSTVTFTATANDPDGDTLAYSWQHFGSTGTKIVSPNAAVITRQFTTAGSYVVTCTVSDMKGGTTTRNQLITVGSSTVFTISGRVTLLGQGIQDVVITANSANGVISDADGYFTIPNLSANTYTLTPLLYGYSFGELFNNSITVGPNFSGANFEATAQSVVTISAPAATANELLPVTPGTFRLTRTGDTSQALTVNVNTAQGSANKTTDYTFAPDYVSGSLGFSTFTIPADATTLDVTVTPVVDTTAEGPETVSLQLGPGNGYLVSTPSKATVSIADDDSTLPKISITATVPDTVENSAAPAILTVTRTGAPSGDLIVNYTLSGTAVEDTDFTNLTGSITIPSGSTSAVVNVTSVNDSISESLETVKLTLAANATYLIDSTANTATANIYDDDTQIVSVTATDATAQEIDLTVPGAAANTGTFLVSRSGDIAAPLTVYYAFAGVYNSGVMALHGVDFEAVSGSVVIPAGQTQASITVVPRFDSIGEGTEQVVLYLGANSSNYTLSSSGTATVTITDNASDLPYIDVVNMGSATEGGGTANFRITVRGGTGTGTLAINYGFTGTAAAGDFSISGTNNTLTGTTITLNNGVTVTRDVTVTAVNDTELEDLEDLTLTLSPSALYQTFAPTVKAAMWLRDNDNLNTVYVDTQVGTSGSSTVTEGTVSTPTKFYVSRTGSTTAALTVNYTTGGLATSGSDYTALSGSVIIPAGSLGVDVPLVITNDTTFEGTETITFDFSAGSYSRSYGALMYIADNDTATATLGFNTPGSSGSESVASVSIPVTLSAAQATTVTVNYAVSGTNSSNNSSTTVHNLPYWVRVVKSGNAITHFESNDGTVWTQRGNSFTVSGLGSSSYLAGIGVASGSTTATTATIDNFTITGLSSGGSTGAETAINIGNASPGGTHSLASGVYSFNTPGNGIATNSTADNFRFVNVPVNSSANCTVTARVVSISTSSSSARLGVLLRSTTAQGSVYAASLATTGTPSNFYTMNRTTLNTASNSPSALTSPVLPQWFRLVRTGDSFATSFSKDGTTWSSIGSTQTIAAGPSVLAGLAVSAASDGTIATGTFDNVTINALPATGLLGRSVGFVNEQGSESSGGGEWTLNGSGSGINGSSDEAHFSATEINGDFTLIGRVTSLTGGGTNAQAGVMMRHTRDGYSRQMYAGWIKSSSIEQRYRLQGVTTAFGSGVDFTLNPDTLTFAPGETTKNIVLSVVNDSVDEPNNLVTIQLSNATGANISSAGTYHGYTIVDDDNAPANPYVGFAAATSTVLESAGTANLEVSLATPATAAVSVGYSVTGGTATDGGTDFTLASGTLSFAAGETVKTIPISITDDTILDAGETITITLAAPVGLQLGSISTHTVTITDNDLPVVTIVATDPTASEAGLDQGEFTFYRTGNTSAALTVNYAVSGTASSATDRQGVSTSVTFQPGFSTVTRLVIPLNDAVGESLETTILTISSDPNYTVGTPNSATVSILDDDRSTITLAANDANASESVGNTGQFTVTRTAPTNVTLAVNLTISGTATNGTDYTTIGATVNFAANDVSKTITVTPTNDSVTEGDEQVTISLATGSYDIGAASFGNVTIADNDNPPVLFINSPTSQGPLVAAANGIIVSATITDDGAPAAVTQTWTQVSGPGIATIESPNAATSAVTFSAPGTYVLRISATDTQFTVSDQVTIVVGSDLVASNWFTQDMAPTSARRGQGLEYGGLFTVSGTGAGYAAQTADKAHLMVRQVSGDGSIVARLTSLPTNGALSGITIRDSMTRGARRAVLGFVPGTGLQFRTRTTVSTNDSVITQTGLSLPLWLKLDRNATTGEITASYAPDVSGAAGTWAAIGTPTTITMDAEAHFGLTTTSNSTASTATGVFDNVTLTPTPVGPALISEDYGATPAAPGTATVAGNTITIAGSTSGYHYGLQYYGDLVVVARLASFSSGAGSASGGIRIAESMELGGQAHLGRMPSGSYSGYYWTSLAGGSGGGVPSGIAAGDWMRIIRKGNSITGYRAPNVAGAPGTWIQIGQPQTVIMTTPVFVGFYVNNASGVGMNTCTFSGVSITALNKAPIVDIASVAPGSVPPISLNGTVTDDNFPAPVNLTNLWSVVSAPGPVTFANATAKQTTATMNDSGTYNLRLTADDSGVQSFKDVSFISSPGSQVPFIQTHPADLAVIPGQPATYSVTAFGGTLSYQWQKDNVDLPNPGANGSTFSIPVTTQADVGNYRVIVSNSTGPSTSNAASLALVTPPVINTHPADVTINTGQSTTLNIAVSGIGLSYQWKFKGTNISGATASSYPITNATTADMGTYVCVVKNIAATIPSNGAFVTVLGIPTVNVHPVPTTVISGAPFSFSVAASGLNLSYQWQRNLQDIPGANASTYAVNVSNIGHAGSYRCIVSNGAGSANSNAAQLTVFTLPVIDSQPVALNVIYNTAATFSVGASGLGLSYQWQKNTTDIPGAVTSSHLINQAQLNDNGSYRCIVSNLAGSVPTSAVLLTVVTQPMITAPPLDQTVNLAAPATFTVTATGSGLSYQWQRNNISIVGANSDTYTITSTTAIDVASYRCVVSNLLGTVKSISAKLTINGLPPILQQPENVAAEAGSTVTLAVGTSGTGITYLWQRNNITIPGKTAATLVLTNFQSANAGEYHCQLTNALGRVYTRAANVILVNNLGTALDDTTRKWQSTGPSEQWKHQTITQHDGVDALQTGALNDGESCALKASVTGPGYVRFWRKISSEAGRDFLRFTIDGVESPDVPAISGEVDWQEARALVTSGIHELKWTYSKDGSGNAGSDSAWLDLFISGPPYYIVTQPENLLRHSGSAATFNVTYQSPSVQTLQWRKNGVNIAGATTTSYTINNVTTTHGGDYTVLIGGKLSSAIAKLCVVGDPPPSRVKEGGTAILTLATGGTGMTYQWNHPNNLTLTGRYGFTGATTNKLTVNFLSAPDTGIYTCTVTAFTPPQTLTLTPCIIGIVTQPVVDAAATPPVAAVSAAGYQWQPVSSQFPTGYTITGLPLGLTYNTATGLVSGTPSVGGDFTIKVTAKNAAGSSTVQSFLLHIQSLPAQSVGAFSALVARNTAINSDLGGLFTATVSSTGSWTGSLTLGADKAIILNGRLQGAVDAAPVLTATISPTLSLTLNFNTDSETITGSLISGSNTAVVDGAQHVWSTTRLATSYNGLYNSTQEVPATQFLDTAIPQGIGYTQLNIPTTSKGVATITGQLGDGTVITQSMTLWPDGRVPMFLVLYAKRGSLIGTHIINAGTEVGFTDNTVSGTLTWNKTGPSSSADKVYPSGFPLISLTTDGAKWLKTAPLLGLTTARVTFTDAKVEDAAQFPSLAQTFPITAANAAQFNTASNPCKVALTLNATTGLFTGSFTLVDSSVSRTGSISGVLLSHRSQGMGRFSLVTPPGLPTSTLTGRTIIASP